MLGRSIEGGPYGTTKTKGDLTKVLMVRPMVGNMENGFEQKLYGGS